MRNFIFYGLSMMFLACGGEEESMDFDPVTTPTSTTTPTNTTTPTSTTTPNPTPGCVPITCEKYAEDVHYDIGISQPYFDFVQVMDACGVISDGCGGTLDCGGCEVGDCEGTLFYSIDREYNLPNVCGAAYGCYTVKIPGEFDAKLACVEVPNLEEFQTAYDSGYSDCHVIQDEYWEEYGLYTVIC